MEFKKHLREISYFKQPVITLKYALKNYFETYAISTELGSSPYSETYLHKFPSGPIVSEGNSNVYIVNYFASITSLHMFFEHKIQEILNEVTPIFTKGRLNKEIDLITALSG